MPPIDVDDSRAPLVVVTYPEIVTPEQLRAAFERYALLSRRHARVAYLIDMSRFDPARSAGDVRKTVGELFLEYQDVLARVTVCEARVVPSFVVRAGLTAFDQLARRKWPCSNFASRADAEAWIATKLRAK